MTVADVTRAADAVRRGGWGDRLRFFGYAVATPACMPYLAEGGDDVIATGVAVRHGPVGWLGTIWTAPAWRGRGIGRAMTERILEDLVGSGCATNLLVATDLGRHVYDRLGFRVLGPEIGLTAPGLDVVTAAVGSPAPGAAAPRVRAFAASDVEPALRLDRAATGEDRRHLVEAAGGDGFAIDADDGDLRGFLLHPPFRGCGVVANDVEAGVALLRAARAAAGPGAEVRIGLTGRNEAGVAALLADGWQQAYEVVRMVRGPDPTWNPAMLFGDFSYATG